MIYVFLLFYYDAAPWCKDYRENIITLMSRVLYFNNPDHHLIHYAFLTECEAGGRCKLTKNL